MHRIAVQPLCSLCKLRTGLACTFFAALSVRLTTLRAPLPTPYFVVPQKETLQSLCLFWKALSRLHTALSVEHPEVSAAAVYVGMSTD